MKTITVLLADLVMFTMVRLLFIAFMLMLGLWGGLEVTGSDMNVIEFTQDAVGSFQQVGDILGGL
jgi:hypothetical protein